MKKNFKKFMALTFAMVLIATTLIGCSDGSDSQTTDSDTAKVDVESLGPVLKKAYETGEITVCIDAVEPPFEFHHMVDGKDTISGIDISLCEYIGKEISDYLGKDVKVNFEDTAWDGCLAGVAAGKYDMVPLCAPTEERKKNMDFSIPYHRSRQVFVVRKDEANDPKFDPEKKLAGVDVGVTKGTSQAVVLPGRYPDVKMKELNGNTDAIMAVLNRKVSAIHIAEKYAILTCKANPELTILEDFTYELTDEEDPGGCIAFQKGNDDLKKILDNMIKRILNDGTFSKMEEDALTILDDPDLLEDFKAKNTIS